MRALFKNLRDSARKDRKDFALTFEEFEAFAIASGYDTARGKTLGCLHVDRINPLEGYHARNIRALEAGENSRKGASEDKKKHWLEARRGRGETVMVQTPLLDPWTDENYVGF